MRRSIQKLPGPRRQRERGPCGDFFRETRTGFLISSGGAPEWKLTPSHLRHYKGLCAWYFLLTSTSFLDKGLLNLRAQGDACVGVFIIGPV